MRPRISAQTVCYLLAGVTKEASRYLRLKYALEYEQKGHVVYSLAKRVYRKQKNYLGVRGHPWLLMKMADVAVDEGLGHGLCRTCNGKGWIDTGIKRIDCFSCHATGSKHSLGDREVADRLNLDLRWYKKHGKKLLLNNMMGVLNSYEGELYTAFKERL